MGFDLMTFKRLTPFPTSICLYMSYAHNTVTVPVVQHLLRDFKVPFTKSEVKKQLVQNPYFPTLYSISNLFSKYKIDNEAYRVEEQDLSQLDPPFITYYNLPGTGKDFIVVKRITDSQVDYMDGSKKLKTVSRPEFVKNWEKVVLLSEVNTASGDPDYEQNRKGEQRKHTIQYAAITGGVVAMLSLLVFYFNALVPAGTATSAAIILLTKLAGLFYCVLLLMFDHDKTNVFVSNFCGVTKQSGCDAVVNNKAGSIMGLKWSEVGFFYFASSFLFLIFPGILFPSKILLLALAAGAVSLYIPYSIYYQAKIAKQWCPLCLGVQSILFIELLWAVFSFWQPATAFEFSLPVLLALLVSILVPISGWFMFKPILSQSKASGQYEAAYKRLLYHPEHFFGLLSQQPEAPAGWETLGIDIGNPEARNTIIKVCGPYCRPCADAHPLLEELIENNKDIKLKIIFTAGNQEQDRSKNIVTHLMAIAAEQDPAQTRQALDEWYGADRKDYYAFAEKYPMNGELAKQGEKLSDMSSWCRQAEVTHTPTLFINGRKLPDNYNIQELKNIF